MDEEIVIDNVKQKKQLRTKKKLDDLLDKDETVIIDNNYQYKNKLKVYVLSGQIKDLYGKIITETELNNLSEQECENIYKLCEIKIATKISESVIDGLVSVVGNLCSKVLPIDDKDKYTADLKKDYIINSELKTIAGNVALRTGRLMGVLSFLIITGSHIQFTRTEVVKEHDKELEQEVDQELNTST